MSIPPGMPAWAMRDLAASLDPPAVTSIGQYVRIMPDGSWCCFPQWLFQGVPGGQVIDDAVTISWALANAGAGMVVRCAPAPFQTYTPVVHASGTLWDGGWTGGAGHLASNTWGPVLQPQTPFQQGGAAAKTVVLLPDGTNGCRIRGLAINGANAPAGVDHIASVGAAESVVLGDITSLNPTGQHINQISGGGSPANADGWRLSDLMLQGGAGVGMTVAGFDMNGHNVHVQNTNGDGLVITGRHNVFDDTCRSDVSATGYGVRFASPYSSSSNDANRWGGRTQFNALGGLITDPANSSLAIIDNATFDGDGTSGAGPGASVVHSGGVLRGAWDTLVTGGFPLYSLATVNGGSAVRAAIDGGYWNAATAPVNDLQGLGARLGISSDAVYSGASGSAPSAGTARFTVTAAMTAGAVTVTGNPWLTATSRIMYCRGTPGGTLGEIGITAQGAGTVTFTSTSNTETSTIEFMILSQ